MSRQLLVSAALLAAGCGGPYPVAGVVTLDGGPLDGATVSFEPEARGQPAVAVTGPDGAFRLGTSAGDGAMPGAYRVTVRKVTGPPAPRFPGVGRGPGNPVTPAEMAEYRRATEEAARRQKSWVPAAYTRADTTPLRVTVPVGGTLRLALTADGQGGVGP